MPRPKTYRLKAISSLMTLRAALPAILTVGLVTFGGQAIAQKAEVRAPVESATAQSANGNATVDADDNVCAKPALFYMIQIKDPERVKNLNANAASLRETFSGLNQQGRSKNGANSNANPTTDPLIAVRTQDQESQLTPYLKPSKAFGGHRFCVVMKNLDVRVQLKKELHLPAELSGAPCVQDAVSRSMELKDPTKPLAIIQARVALNEKLKSIFYTPFFVSTKADLTQVMDAKMVESQQMLSMHFLQKPMGLHKKEIDPALMKACPVEEQALFQKL